MTNSEVCISCRKPKGQYHCGLCEEPVCRECALFLEEGTFAFFPKLPESLGFSYYCAPCHEQQVVPELERYQEILERAKQVYFYFDSRKKPIQTLKKSREEISVPFCEDRDQTILHLGFQAASLGFNAVIDASVVCEKVRDHGWQKMKWRGTGWPANVDGEKLERQEAYERTLRLKT